MTAIGKRVRELREERGLLQRQLAQKADLEINSVSRVELGHHTPSADTIVKLAKGLDVEPGVLFKDPLAPVPEEADFSGQPPRVRIAVLETWLEHFRKLETRREEEFDAWREAKSVPYMAPLEWYAFDRLDQKRYEQEGLHTHTENVVSKRLKVSEGEYGLCVGVNEAIAAVNELTAQARNLARMYGDAEQAREVQTIAHELETIKLGK